MRPLSTDSATTDYKRVSRYGGRRAAGGGRRAAALASRRKCIVLRDLLGRNGRGALADNDGASTPAAGATDTMQVDDVIASISTLDIRTLD
ncbi:hypothetical protein EVAR_21394_1 [Eumeta japonica]|uniref:Uncharacterized protein n=1 Tax=Eumeta variegata TaxID=151549 RepID=A0A4C1VH17_EUMVA|nr:hypothetical protein EVAR_21394_1 [Eumeta japonica]